MAMAPVASSSLAQCNASRPPLPVEELMLHEWSAINPRVPGNRLYQKPNGEFVLIPKSPAEVVGEKVLRPLIDGVAYLAKRFFSALPRPQLPSSQLFQWVKKPSIPFPSFFPGAQAHPMDGVQEVGEVFTPTSLASQQRIATSGTSLSLASDPVADGLRSTYNSLTDISLSVLKQTKIISVKELYVPPVFLQEKEGHQTSTDRKTPSKSEFISGPVIKIEEFFELESVKTAAKKHILIQAPAGFGKDALCKYIAYQWGTGEFFKGFDHLFWIQLSEIKDPGSTLEKIISKQLDLSESDVSDLLGLQQKNTGTPEFLQAQQRRDRILILLNGYDELSPDIENPKCKILMNIREKFKHIIILTRPQSVTSFDPAVSLRILGFDEKGIPQYIAKFFSAIHQEQKAANLLQALRNPRINDLAHIPFNLEAFCSFEANDRSILLWFNNNLTNTEIYSRIIDEYLRSFRISRNQEQESKVKDDPCPVEAASVKSLVKALEEVAWLMMKSQPSEEAEARLINLVVQGTSTGEVNIEKVKRVGPLVLRDKKVDFVHPTYKEYFAAAYLANLYRGTPEEVKEAKKELVEIKFNFSYRRMLALTAGLLSYQSTHPCTEEQKNTKPQVFCDDLFSKPRDIVSYEDITSYELGLYSGCFGECSQPESIRQYVNFIDQVIVFLKNHPNEWLKINLLAENSKLLSDSRVNQILIEGLDGIQRTSFLRVLNQLAKQRQKLPDLILSKLLTNPTEGAMRILAQVADNGDTLPPSTVDILLELFQDKPQGQFFLTGGQGQIQFSIKSDTTTTKSTAAEALAAIASRDAALSNKIQAQLIHILISTTDFITQYSIGIVFSFMADRNATVSPYASIALIGTLTNQDLTSDQSSSLTRLFSWMARDSYPDRIVQQKLIQMMEDMKCSFQVQSFAADMLIAVKIHGGHLDHTIASRLSTILSNSRASTDTKMTVNYALVWLAEGLSMQAQAIINLKNILNYGHSWDKRSYIPQVLRKVAESSHPLKDQAQDALFYILENVETYGNYTISRAGDALRGMVSKGKPLHFQSEQVLVNILPKQISENAKRSIVEIFVSIVRKGGVLSVPAKRALIRVLDEGPRYVSAVDASLKVFRQIAKQGLRLSQHTQTKIISVLKNPEFKFARSTAIRVIIDLAKNGHPLSDNPLPVLLSILGGPEEDSARVVAAEAIKELTKCCYSLAGDTLSDLLNILENPQEKLEIKVFVSQALAEMAKQGSPIPPEALDLLIKVLKSSFKNFWEAEYYANIATAAEEIIKNIPDSSQVTKSVLELSSLTGNAFFCLREDLYFSHRSESNPFHQACKAPLWKQIMDGTPSELLTFLKKGDETLEFKVSIANVLAEKAKQGEALPEETLDLFMDVLRGPFNNPMEADNLVAATEKMIKDILDKGKTKRALEFSSQIQLPSLRGSIAHALAAKAKQGEALPAEALDLFMDVLKGPFNSPVEADNLVAATEKMIKDTPDKEQRMVRALEFRSLVNALRYSLWKELIRIGALMISGGSLLFTIAINIKRIYKSCKCSRPTLEIDELNVGDDAQFDGRALGDGHMHLRRVNARGRGVMRVGAGERDE